MKIRLWGTRGSIPVSSPQMARYGGDTSCLEILSDAGDRLILDAGTGIHALGLSLNHTPFGHCTVCFSHTHWDHIQGLPYFKPLYNPHWQISLRGPALPGKHSFTDALKELFDKKHFPVAWEDLPERPLVEFAPGDCFDVNSFKVSTCATEHPGLCVAYRVEADGWSFVYSGDHECGERHDTSVRERLLDFMTGADVALVDGHYYEKDYFLHTGWGHSALEHWPVALARRGVKHLIYAHYDSSYCDRDLDKKQDALRQEFEHLPIDIQMGRQGMSIDKKGGQEDFPNENLESIDCKLCEFFHRISHFSDTNIVLDSILSQARLLSKADAGTIYLKENNRLVFAHTQNDTLFPGSAANKYTYLNASLPLDTTSIAGFVACTGRALNLPDVRGIPASEPYAFNDAFDLSAGYRTTSMLTLPFTNAEHQVLGVLQLINSVENGRVQAFTPNMVLYVGRLVMLAANALERARLANDLILRMLKTAALRDPRETASHVRRVGAMAAEIYHRWADKHGLSLEEIRATKGRLRLAAMLHDVGKVGIPDAILKKPGRLTSEERKIMEKHSILGARLFENATQDVDLLAHDIALHHHQRWDGTGYTGSDEHPRLAGTDIPLEARITAIADVYDALISRRCYKEAWGVDEALAILRKDAGSHFDPELVDTFMEIHDVVVAIRKRFPDHDED